MSILTGKTILLVDDEAIIAMSESKMLERNGCAVITAFSGETAVATLRENPAIDLVLMDIDLGQGIDGTAAAAMILKIRDIPIVFLSSHTEPAIVERTEGITSYGYVVKDSGETVLVASIKMAFRLFETRFKLQEKSEELEAANEEMNAAVEELEATNEELLTTQEEIFKLTAMLEQTFEQSPIPMVLVSMPDMIIRILNPVCSEFLGIKDEPSPVGRSLLDFKASFRVYELQGTTTEIGNLPLARSLRGEKTVNEEHSIIRKDGTDRCALSHAIPILNANGEVIAGYLILIDITDLRKADAAIRESEQMYRSLFENMMNGFAYCKMIFEGDRPVDFIYLEINRAFESQTGLMGVAGKRVTEVIPGIRESDPALFEIYGRVSRTGTPETFEMFVEALDMWFSISVYSPRYEHFVAVFDVITERKRAEQELMLTNERLQLSQEAAGTGVWDWDVKNQSIEWTPRMFELFGLDPNAASASFETWRAAVHPDDLVTAESNIMKSLNEHTTLLNVYRIVLPDGNVRWINALGKGLYGDDGAPHRMIGICIDVTERQRSNEILREREARLRSYFDLPLIGIAVTSLNKGWLEANASLCDMLGYSADELFRMTWSELTHPEDLDLDVNQFNRVLAGEIDTYALEKRFIRKNCDVIWTNLSVSCVRKSDRSVDYFIALLQDISARKEAERELNRSELQLKSISDNLPATMIYQIIREQDGSRRFTYLSDTVRNFYGCTPGEAIANPGLIYGRVAEEDRIPLMEAEEKSNRELTRFEFEARVNAPSGNIRWSHFKSTPMLLPDGTTRWDGIEIDITDRKLLEDVLRQSIAEKETLLRELQHRVKNSLSLISSLASIESGKTDDSVARDSLRNMEGRIRSLAELYTILSEAGAIGTIRIDDYLGRIVSGLKRSLLHGVSRITIGFAGDDITLDVSKATALGLIVNELATNAIKHAFPDERAGATDITLRKDRDHLVLAISDNGIGPREGFDIYRATGTGIKIVSLLVEQLNGTISFQRTDGQSVFTVRAPIS